jgi:hypothetical protein
MVPISDSAFRAARAKVLAEPLDLPRAPRGEVAVERDRVPGPHVVTVIAQTPWSGCQSEVIEVRRRDGRVGIFVVSWRRPRAVLLPAPRRIVAITVLLGRALEVRIVASGKDRSAD